MISLRRLGTDTTSLEWRLAMPVLQELRPKLTRQTLQAIVEAGAEERLSFVAAFATGHGTVPGCVGVAGWRIMTCTSAGMKAHVDDLVTAPAARGQGVAATLLDEVVRQARGAGCSSLELDSGVQRYAAHRFYHRERMTISAHHFTLDLVNSDARAD